MCMPRGVLTLSCGDASSESSTGSCPPLATSSSSNGKKKKKKAKQKQKAKKKSKRDYAAQIQHASSTEDSMPPMCSGSASSNDSMPGLTSSS